MLEEMQQVIDHFRRGGMLLVVDHEERENEGDLCLAAVHATPEAITFMAREGCGLICVALDGDRVDELELPPMVSNGENRGLHGTAFTVSVDAAGGTTTGISAQDRAHTLRMLASSTATAKDFVRPGHVFPLRARQGGTLVRAGHTEAGVDLARLAGLPPATVICEVLNEDGTMMRMPDLREFGRRHAIPLISIAELIEYRRAELARSRKGLVTHLADAIVPSEYGPFRVHVYADSEGREHLAFVKGELRAYELPITTRLHSECLTGDALGSRRCDCGGQLDAAMRTIADQECGVLLYLRQEGRGIGLAAKIRAYALQDRGFDTVNANHQLGFPSDARDYAVAAGMLDELGIREVRLMTNNPLKVSGLTELGITVVERIPLEIAPTLENARYLATKRSKLGHSLEAFDAARAGSTDVDNRNPVEEGSP